MCVCVCVRVCDAQTIQQGISPSPEAEKALVSNCSTNSRNLNPLGTEGAEAKFWLSASNIGRGGGGVGGGGSMGGGGVPPLLLRCTAIVILHWGGG